MVTVTYEVQLPREVIATIISHIPYDRDRLRTLWSCCLLSHEWYGTAIGPLYHRPRLSNKNFDKFAHTICPPVNSHIRQIGLESLVHHLDMGKLAYESTKSLTARMLRRTRVNLEVFVAPAVSFSISCLAPLSKCANLRVLDLSRDFYDLELGQLLKSIRKLSIEYLSLPRSAMRRRCQLAPRNSEHAPWPATLKHLEITDWLPQDLSYWEDLFRSLPEALMVLAFEECSNWNPFWQIYYGDIVVDGIQDLRISLRREAGRFPVAVILKIFPTVKFLTLPTPRLNLEPSYRPDDVLPQNPETQLEILTFGKIPGVLGSGSVLSTDIIAELVFSNERLIKIVIPEGYLQIDGDELTNHVERIEEVMAIRAAEGVESGIYLS